MQKFLRVETPDTKGEVATNINRIAAITTSRNGQTKIYLAASYPNWFPVSYTAATNFIEIMKPLDEQ